MFDDPTLPGRRASYDYDDEGELGRRTQLVTDGRWTDLLLDAERSSRLGMPAGHGRRVPWAQRCLPRMSNTYLDGGTESVSALIRAIDKGLICGGTWGGGSVGPGFIMRPAYGRWISGGRLTDRIVRRFDLVGNKFETIAAIGGVSEQTCWFSPFYGCDKEGQNNLPVTHGSPHVLLRRTSLRLIARDGRGTGP